MRKTFEKLKSIDLRVETPSRQALWQHATVYLVTTLENVSILYRMLQRMRVEGRIYVNNNNQEN